MEWKKHRLRDLALSIQTGPFGSQLHQADYSDSGIPVIMPKDMINGKVETNDIARVSDIHVQRLKRHKVKSGDIIYSRRGDVGRCSLITEREEGWLCGTGCLKVALDKSKCVPSFIAFILQRKDSIGWVENHAVGATMPNLNTGILSNLPLIIPTFEEQGRIASILSVYDNLIENNNKRIRLLEQMAENLYKEWFVRFRFPGHEKAEFENGLPKGWKTIHIKDITSLKSGYAFKSEWFTDDGCCVAKIKDIGNTIMDTSDFSYVDERNCLKAKRFILNEGDMTIALTGATIGKISIVPRYTKTIYTNQRLGKFFNGDKPILKLPFLYCLFSQPQMTQMILNLSNSSSAQPNISPEQIEGIKFIGNLNLIKEFNMRTWSLYKQILNLYYKNETLSRQRDLLLPRLMSGKLEVKV